MEQVPVCPELTEDILLHIIPGFVSTQISKTIAEKNRRKFIQECVSTYPSIKEIVNYCHSVRLSTSPCKVVLFQTIHSTEGSVYVDYNDESSYSGTKADRLFHTYSFEQGTNQNTFFNHTDSIGFAYCTSGKLPTLLMQCAFFDVCIDMTKIDPDIINLIREMNFLEFHEGNQFITPEDVFEFSVRLDLLSVYNIMCNRLTSLSNTERLSAVALIKQFLVQRVDMILMNGAYTNQVERELSYNLFAFNHGRYPRNTSNYSPKEKKWVCDELKRLIMNL